MRRIRVGIPFYQHVYLRPMNLQDLSILAVETATQVCSAALITREKKIHTRSVVGNGRHAEQLLPFIRELLDEAGVQVKDIGAVAISSGPGSFTGLRVASSSIRGLIYDTEIPVLSCNTLAGIAAGAIKKYPDAEKVHAVIDARRQHLYYQPFLNIEGFPEPGHEVKIMPLDQFEGLIRPGEVIAGTGIERLPEPLVSSVKKCGIECITAEGLISLVRHWIKKGQPETELINKVPIGEYQPDYHSEGPPPPQKPSP